MTEVLEIFFALRSHVLSINIDPCCFAITKRDPCLKVWCAEASKADLDVTVIIPSATGINVHG